MSRNADKTISDTTTISIIVFAPKKAAIAAVGNMIDQTARRFLNDDCVSVIDV